MEGDTIVPPIFRVKPRRPRKMRIREQDENRSQTKLRRSGDSVTCPPSASRGKARGGARGRGRNSASTSSVPQTTVLAASGAPDVPIAHAGSAPNDAPAATNYASTTTANTRINRSRIAARRGGGRGRGRGRIPITTIPDVPAALSAPVATRVPPLPTSFTSQPPTTASPKTKVLGVRRSGRLKLGVIKSKAGTSDTIDLTTD
ncbi:hypothetical protein PIB30_101344 [Stylosanthes scabra]|uniref:Uncharacterized protein n=1 Tax=Stylosanthes scabra TaxID=79078 RepID=A0ABU6XUX0_9FABA|nr:hypothetical protein [Stylosanthes scabra]